MKPIDPDQLESVERRTDEMKDQLLQLSSDVAKLVEAVSYFLLSYALGCFKHFCLPRASF